ncbi:MAG: 3-methyl-2-oxobutanoate hydroxymethyltransferase [Cardiobacteriaceae bacterium]|nr:3-methyl-2-oxobutanoate hydroxymethyltransferase [Cardiobacteriaceae bacterium]
MKTLRDFAKARKSGEKIAMLTAYDASFARLAAEAGADCLLVGDSLGMVVAGHQSTVPVSVAEMAYHAAAVARGAPDCWRVVDMPYLSYATPEQALETARLLMQQGQANMVKLEGGSVAQINVIAALHDCHVPVCAHLGLTPQSVDKLGGYRQVGRSETEAAWLRERAKDLELAGADMLVLECVPPALAADITKNAGIPVIGIGCGKETDGQVLVSYDVLGISPHLPYFSKNFMSDRGIAAAFADYVAAVKSQTFPEAQHARD